MDYSCIVTDFVGTGFLLLCLTIVAIVAVRERLTNRRLRQALSQPETISPALSRKVQKSGREGIPSS